MEPQSDDGLVYWNYFDEYLKKAGVEKGGVAFPVIKTSAEMTDIFQSSVKRFPLSRE
ncbi:MAG: hypothetical protein WC865_07925 [Bacteroidales bacterium]